MAGKDQARDTLEETIYMGIKEAIARGQLVPGMHLTEAAVTRHFGGSRTPARAALRRLAAEGLIQYSSRRGAQLPVPDPSEIHQVFELRRLLEAVAARKAAEHTSPQLVAELKGALLQEAAAHQQHDRLGVVTHSTTFHLTIARTAGGVWLYRFIHDLVLRSNVFLLFYDPMHYDPPHSPTEHNRIVELLAAGQPAAAAQAMTEHLETVERDLVIRAQQAPPSPWLF